VSASVSGLRGMRFYFRELLIDTKPRTLVAMIRHEDGS